MGGTKRLAETAQSPTPTQKSTIIFADGGQIGESLLHNVVPDPRPPLDIFDVPEINDELGANCVLQVDWLGKKPFISVITAEVDLCSLDEVLLSSQAFSFPASLATIRHPGLFSGELRVLGVRIIKDKTDLELFFSTERRKALAFALFNFLIEANKPTVIVGNVGMALACLLYACEASTCDKMQDIAGHMDILMSPDRQLVCLHRRFHGSSVVSVNIAATARIFVFTWMSGDGHDPSCSAGDRPAA